MNAEASHGKPWYRLRNILLAITMAIVAVVGWIALDLWLVYADKVPADRPYRAQIIEYCAAGQPKGENGWPALAAVLQQVHETEDAIFEQTGAGYWSQDAATDAAVSAALIQFDLTEEMRSSLDMPRYVRPWSSNGFFMDELVPLARPARTLSRALGDRARAAAEQGDWATVVDSFHLGNRLADVISLQPLTVLKIVGLSIQIHALETMRVVFNEHTVPPSVAQEIIAIIEAVDDPEILRHLEYERLFIQHILHWTHGSRGYVLPLTTLFDTSSSAGGLTSMGVVDPLNDDRSFGRAFLSRWVLATREESASLVDRWYAALKAQADLPFATRWDNWPPAGIMPEIRSPRFAVVSQFLPALESLVDASETSVIELRATYLMAVIEQYQATHGRPPASLDALVPEWIDVLPTDPLHGGSFGYRVLEDDPHGRAYVLYTFGPDGLDNNNLAPRIEPDRLMYRMAEGTDFELNRPVEE